MTEDNAHTPQIADSTPISTSPWTKRVVSQNYNNVKANSPREAALQAIEAVLRPLEGKELHYSSFDTPAEKKNSLDSLLLLCRTSGVDQATYEEAISALSTRLNLPYDRRDEPSLAETKACMDGLNALRDLNPMSAAEAEQYHINQASANPNSPWR